MSAPSSAQPSSALRAPRPALQCCLTWLAATPVVAVLCLTAATEARAVSFGSPEEPNPFLLDEWIPSDVSADTSLLDPTGASFLSPPDDNDATYTFTSGLTDRPYRIFFNYDFFPDNEGAGGPSASYQICSSSTNCTSPTDTSLGESGFRFFYLTSNQALRFSITNSPTLGGAYLQVTNFNATAVPSPLPTAGLGLAALGIYRARRRKSSHT